MDRKWTREEVEKTLKGILVDALSVEEEKIAPEASLVHDLGVESIDFLDIGFRVQQTFGVELPNKVIQEMTLNWRNLGELKQLLEERYGVQIGPEEIRQFRTMGIPDVLRCVSEKGGVTLQNGESEKVAAELVRRLLQGTGAMGFRASVIDEEEIKKLLFQNLSSPKIIEAILRLFSVGSLVDFIAAQVGEREKVNRQ